MEQVRELEELLKQLELAAVSRPRAQDELRSVRDEVRDELAKARTVFG